MTRNVLPNHSSNDAWQVLQLSDYAVRAAI